MHILFISGMDPRGGEAQGLRQTVEGIRKYYPSVKISVVLPKGTRWKKFYRKKANEYRSIGCNVYQEYYVSAIQNVPFPKYKLLIKYPVRLPQYLYGRFAAAPLLSRKINWDEIDVIHANSSREDIGAILAFKHNKPLVWHIREYGDIDYRCFSYRKNYIDFMNKHAHLFITMSDVIRLHWINKGLNAGKAITVYDGIYEKISPKQYYNDGSGQLKFVILGSVQETKGQNRLIEALGRISREKIAKIHVDIIGGLEQSVFTENLKKRITDLGLNGIVSLLGYRENFRENLREYDCGLMCSKSEAFGFVTVEYMAAGLPVIAAATGANPEIVLDGEVGFLYKPEGPESLAQKIEIIIDRPELCMVMGRKAAKYVRDRFSLKNEIESLYEIYKRLSGGDMCGPNDLN